MLCSSSSSLEHNSQHMTAKPSHIEYSCSTQHLLAKGDIESGLAIETSDGPYAVKLAFANDNVCRRHRQLA